MGVALLTVVALRLGILDGVAEAGVIVAAFCRILSVCAGLRGK